MSARTYADGTPANVGDAGQGGEPMTEITARTKVRTMKQILGPTANELAEGRMKIRADALLRIEYRDDDGRWCYTVSDRLSPTGKRIARLRISSYTEIGSISAMHWYADILADVHIARPSEGSVSMIGGYLGKNANALGIDKWARDISIEIRRKIRAGERDANGDRIGRAGEMTRRLDSKQEAFDLGLATFAKRFGPGWVLLDDRKMLYEDPSDCIISETGDSK